MVMRTPVEGNVGCERSKPAAYSWSLLEKRKATRTVRLASLKLLSEITANGCDLPHRQGRRSVDPGLLRRLGDEVLLRGADEVEAAGDADEVFLGDRAIRDRQRRL